MTSQIETDQKHRRTYLKRRIAHIQNSSNNESKPAWKVLLGINTLQKDSRKVIIAEIFDSSREYKKLINKINIATAQAKPGEPASKRAFALNKQNEFSGKLKPIREPQVIPYQQVDRSQLKKEREKITNIRDINLIELIVQTADKMIPYYEAANHSLKIDRKYGFATHDIYHIVRTTIRTLYLIEQAEYAGNKKVTKESALIAVLAALHHDLGNMLGRKHENEISVLLAQEISPWLYKKYPELTRQVNRTIRLHSRRQFVNEIRQKDQSKTADKVIESMYHSWPPPILALFLADKLDRGRQRVEGDSLSPEAFDNDPHTFLNFFMQTEDKGTGVRIIEKDYPPEMKDADKNRQFIWNIAYTPYIAEEDQNRYSKLITGEKAPNGKFMAYVPENIKTNPEYESLSDFERFQKKLWKTSYEKLLSGAMAAFALIPKLENFSFVFKHPDGSEKIIVLKRGQVQEKIDKIMEENGILKKSAII